MNRQAYRHTRCRGAALVVALILLMVMSLLSLSSMHTTSTQERMSANIYDRSLAFQAAETALREGEAAALAWSEGNNPPIVDALASDNTCLQTSCNQDGLCQIPDPDCSTPRWDSPLQGWKDIEAMEGLSGTPQYIVEALSITAPCDPAEPTSNLNCKRFRVTARSTADGRASVTLQSIYATP